MIHGGDNRDLMERVRRHPDFRDFVVPLSEMDAIRDATFFLRRDGLLAFSEGYCHPPGRLVGNIIYIPDPAGTKNFFGVPYGSVIKNYGGPEETWIPFRRQVELYRAIDPSTQEGKPVFAEYKCVFDLGDFIGYLPTRRSLRIVRERSPAIDRTMRGTARLLGLDVDRIGCTGSMAFGNIEEAHDFDLVFHGRVAELRGALAAIYEVVKDPARQVFEMGMHWAIRFYDDAGNMICPFFSYAEPAEIPLPAFEMDVLDRRVEVECTIANDDHTGFMPTYLPLAEATGGVRVLIIYHGGKRGEYRTGDRVRARGAAVRVRTRGEAFEAVLVTDMDDTEKIGASG
ncbi:MAG: hypothetical protein PHN82_12220 [bacterium]|nr:hypothetical protein [bacterium]